MKEFNLLTQKYEVCTDLANLTQMHNALKTAADTDKADLKHFKQEKIVFVIAANRDFGLAQNFAADDALEEITAAIMAELRELRMGVP